jgi:hypothetical protein
MAVRIRVVSRALVGLGAKLVLTGIVATLALVGVVATLALVGVVATPLAHAEGTPSFAGQWATSALVATWSIGDWGEACGPQPTGGGEHGGTATVEQVGNELAFSGIGRAYSTSLCWEQLPGLQRTSHTAGPRGWRTTCKSPPGDPRVSSLVTTVTVVDENQLTFDETGQYQFVIKGQNCTASVRRTRVFKRLVAAAPAPATASTGITTTPTSTAKPSNAPAATTSTAKSPACASPGAPARIELRPSHKLMKPGETFVFRASVQDSHACTLPVTPAFRLDGDAVGVSITSAGKVTVDETAADAQVKIVAAVGARSVQATLDVVSRERYEAMLAQGGFDPSGASTDAAIARFESGSVGSRSTVLEDESGRKRAVFVGIVGAAALALGAVGLFLVRRGRKRSAGSPASARAARAPNEPSRPLTVCPTCRDEYPPEAQFCPKDGNRLVPLERGAPLGPAGAVCPVCGQGYDPGVSVCPKHDEPLVPPLVYAGQQTPVAETRKICPVCGAQFGGESQFCGACGAALVPVN